jgi:hypothetical protein
MLQFPIGPRDFFSSEVSRLVLGPGCETDHSCPSDSSIRICGAAVSLPDTTSWHA